MNSAASATSARGDEPPGAALQRQAAADRALERRPDPGDRPEEDQVREVEVLVLEADRVAAQDAAEHCRHEFTRRDKVLSCRIMTC